MSSQPNKSPSESPSAASTGKSLQLGRPAAPPIVPASVWQCDSIEHAEQIVGGQVNEFLYQRERHPNADWLAAKLADLAGGEAGMVTASGMGALASVVLSELTSGDHVLVSDRLYGRCTQLLSELPTKGIATTTVDALNLDTVIAACQPNTKMLFVETISNPRLRVVDVPALAKIMHDRGGRLIVDNTFASPLLCQPLKVGADLVWESASKIVNGHSDVMLGSVVGDAALIKRLAYTASTWGLAASPFDCWLTERSLETLELRVARAVANATEVARLLAEREIPVDYPLLESHPDFDVAKKLLPNGGGWVVTFHLPSREVAEKFIANSGIPFFPSLGESRTSLSHPRSTSHRALSDADGQRLGIREGTIRLSCGLEAKEDVLQRLEAGIR